MTPLVQLLLAAIAAVFLLSSSTAAQVTCGVGPFDLTSLQNGPDLILDSFWVVHPCGVVSTSGYCTGTFCQGTNNVAFWVQDESNYNVDNSPIWSTVIRAGQVGVAQIVQDGDNCGGSVGDRQGTIEYVCNPNATTAYISAAWETITCHYSAIIQTSAVCGVTLEAALDSGLPLISTQCGGGLYDLSALDMDIVDSTDGVIIHPCGTVAAATNTYCNQNGLSVCQTSNNALATYAPYYWPVLYQPIPGGVVQIIQDGAACNQEERLVNITYICDLSATTPILTAGPESPTCHYHYTVSTSALCNQTMTIPSLALTSATNCKYGPFDLNPITDTVLTVYTDGNPWLIKPCGFNTDFGYCPGQFCQGSTTVDYYNDSTSNSAQYQSATGSVSTPYWAAATLNGMSGVAQIIQDGTDCVVNNTYVGARQGVIYYLCDETATTPVIDTIYESPQCHYNAVILTNVVCGVSTSALQQPGVGVISDICGGGIYDLSSLSADITGYNFVGYNWTINLCGPVTTVADSACNTNNASSCQYLGDPSSPQYPYSLSFWEPSTYPYVWTYLGNGVSEFVQDGSNSCGGTNTDRQTNISVICNKAATTPIMTAAYQLQECWYDIIIESDAVCSGPLFAAAPGAPVGSSSSSAAPAAASSSSSAVSAAPASSSSSAAAVSAGSSSSAASAGAASSSSAVSAASAASSSSAAGAVSASSSAAASSSSIATTSAASALSSAATSAPSSAATSSPAAASSSTSTVAAASVTSSSSSAAAAAAVTSSSSAPAAASSSAATFVTSSTAPPPPAGVVSSSSSVLTPPPASPTSTVSVSSVPVVPSSTAVMVPVMANGASTVRLTGAAVMAAAVVVAALLL